MSNQLQPIPNQPISNTHEWREWFFKLWESLGGTGGQIYYTDLNFTSSKITSICHFLMLAAISLLICFPLIWALSTSLKPKSELSVMPPTIIPKNITLENYQHLITGKAQNFSADLAYKANSTPPQYFIGWFLNSFIVSLYCPPIF
jgi:ABC-type glycerol-3-phosphate transport system permease component